MPTKVSAEIDLLGGWMPPIAARPIANPGVDRLNKHGALIAICLPIRPIPGGALLLDRFICKSRPSASTRAVSR